MARAFAVDDMESIPTRNSMRRVGSALWLLVLFLLTVCVGSNSTWAHTVEGVEDLRFIGYAQPFGNDGTTTYTDVWGDGDYGFIGSLESGVAIIDVSGADFGAVPVGTYVPETPQQFYDIKVRDGFGYFSSLSGGGTFVVDVSDPTAAFTVTHIDSAIGGHDNVRNAAIGGNYLYQIDDSSALIHVFDISAPASPAFVRTIDTGDSVGVYDATVIGNRLYASGLGGISGEGAVYVYDVTDLAADTPPLIGQVPTGANTSSAWPTHNANYLVVTHRELGGRTSIWDISDLSQPSLATSADASDLAINSYSTSEVVVLDDILYVAWWQAGVQVLDLDNDLLNNGVQLIGQLDTSNDSNPLSGFVGNQSVYPLLGHGKVLLSDTKWGFFVVSSNFVLPPLPNYGDFDGNGETDGLDFLAWQRGFGITAGANGSDGDADADGDVDHDDLIAWEQNYGSPWGLGVGQSVAIPEPASIVTMGIALATFLLLPRRFRARAPHLEQEQAILAPSLLHIFLSLKEA